MCERHLCQHVNSIVFIMSIFWWPILWWPMTKTVWHQLARSFCLLGCSVPHAYGCFLLSVNMRIMDLHTLHSLSYVHPVLSPNTQRGQEVYSNLCAQKTKSRKYLEICSNDYRSPHLLYSIRRVSKHVLSLMFYRFRESKCLLIAFILPRIQAMFP